MILYQYYVILCYSVYSFLSELLQNRVEQRGDVHPLHPQAVRPAPEGAELHRYLGAHTKGLQCVLCVCLSVACVFFLPSKRTDRCFTLCAHSPSLPLSLSLCPPQRRPTPCCSTTSCWSGPTGPCASSSTTPCRASGSGRSTCT